MRWPWPVVYFAELDGIIKIGCSCNIEQRMAALKTTPLGAFPGSFDMERATHQHFADLALGHEWFTDDDRIRAFVASHCTLPPWDICTPWLTLAEAEDYAGVPADELFRWVDAGMEAYFTPARRTPKFTPRWIDGFLVRRELGLPTAVAA